MILTAPPIARRDNPFLGLAYYSREDAERFSGRDGDVEAVTNGILRTRTFVVFGRSGLGKTSLLQAGVFPRLAQEDRNCLPVYVRTLEDPLLDLRRALVAQGKLKCNSESSDLAQLIERAGHDEEGGRDRLVVLVFDQFEEFFVRFADQPEPAGGLRHEEELDRTTRQQRVAQRTTFIEEMGRLAAASDLNLRLVFSLREDWIAEMEDFSRAIPEITRNTYRLLPLTPFGVRQTVAATLRRAGIDFDAGLISALVEALAEVSFDPAVLQVMGCELWDRARERSGEGSVRLEVSDLQAVGDVKKVFQGFLDQVSREIPEGELRRKIQTRAVLEALTTEKRTKRALSREALLEQYFAITPEELDHVLERLYHHRLVRLDPRGESRWFELVHERLVELILRWLDSDLDFFNFRSARKLVVNSCANSGWRQNPELLLNQGQLDGTVEPFKDLLRFNEEERFFLVSSAVYRQSRELSFWAELAGYGVSADLLDHFLDQKGNDEVRQRATEAASQIGERPQHFAMRCLDLALHDPSESVRRSAARSFADLASLEDFQRLAQVLAGKGERQTAIDVLSEIIDKNKLPKGVTFGFFNLRRARKKLYKRRISKSREAIQERGIKGAATGLLAGLIWMATAGLMILHTVLFEIFPAKGVGEPQSFLLFGAYAFLLCPLIGSLVGYVASRRAARGALRYGYEGRLVSAFVGGLRSFFLVIMISSALIWTSLVTPASLLARTLAEATIAHILLGSFAIFSWFVFIILLWPTLIARLAWPDVWSCRGKYATWIWAWVWSFGGSLLPSLVVWYLSTSISGLARRASSDGIDGLVLAIMVPCLLLFIYAALTCGLVAFAGLMSLSRSFPRANQARFQPLGKLPAEPTLFSRRLRRGIGLVLLGATGLLWFLAFRFDGLPFLSHEWPSREPFNARFGHGPVGTYHLNLRLPTPGERKKNTSGPRLLRITLSSWSHAYLWGLGEIESGETYVLNPGEYRLALEAGTIRAGTQNLQIETDQDFGKGVYGRPQLAILRLARRANAWSGDLPSLPPSAGIFLSRTAHGGAWCRDERFVIKLASSRGTEYYGGSSCQGENKKVEFDKIPIYSAHRIMLEIWHTISALKPADSGVRGFLSQDGARFARVSEDLTRVSLWPVANSGEPISLQINKKIQKIVPSSDRRFVLIMSSDGAQIWEPGGGVRTPALPPLDQLTQDSIKISTDGNRVWGNDSDGNIFVSQVGREDVIKFYPGEDASVYASSDARKMIALSPKDGSLRLWEEGRLSIIAQNGVRDASISPRGDRLAIVDDNYRARVLDLSADGEPWTLPQGEEVSWIYDSPRGDRVLTEAKDGLVKVWMVDSQEDPIVLQDSRQNGILRFSPDGEQLIRISKKDSRVWNIATGGPPVLVPFGDEEDFVESRLIIENGHVVVLSRDGTVRVWAPQLPSKTGDLFLALEVLKRTGAPNSEGN